VSAHFLINVRHLTIILRSFKSEKHALTVRIWSTWFTSRKTSRTWILELCFEWVSCNLGYAPKL